MSHIEAMPSPVIQYGCKQYQMYVIPVPTLGGVSRIGQRIAQRCRELSWRLYKDASRYIARISTEITANMTNGPWIWRRFPFMAVNIAQAIAHTCTKL